MSQTTSKDGPPRMQNAPKVDLAVLVPSLNETETVPVGVDKDRGNDPTCVVFPISLGSQASVAGLFLGVLSVGVKHS